MKKRGCILIGVCSLLVFLTAIALFPSVVKVQIYYPNEQDFHIYLLQGEKLENSSPLAFKKFTSGDIVLPFAEEELDTFDYIQIKFEGRELDDELPVPVISAALGNYVFYRGDFQDTAHIMCHDLMFGADTGQLTIAGGEPFLLLRVPAEELQKSKGRIMLQYGGAWLMAWLLCLFVFFRKQTVITEYLRALYGRFVSEWKQLCMLAGFVLGGLLAGWGLQWCNSRYFHWRELQNSEIIVWAAACGIVFWLLQKRIDRKSCAILAGVLIAIGMLVSIKGMTTYLTADERFSTMEQAKLDADELRHWSMGQSRMNYLLMSLFWRCFPYEWMEEVTGLVYHQPAKLAHWFLGVLILLYMVDLVQRFLIRRSGDVKQAAESFRIMTSYVVLMNLTLLLPAVTIGLKNYNYDLFSACFGALGGVCALLSFQKRSLSFGYKAVLFSACSVLEKKSGLPVLLAACTVTAAVAMLKQEGKQASKVLAGVRHSLLGVAFYVGLIFTNQFLLVEVIKNSHAPVHTFASAMQTAVRMIPGVYDLSVRMGSGAYLQAFSGCIFLTGLIFLAAMVLYGICLYYEAEDRDLYRVSAVAAMLLLTVFLLTGMILMFSGAGYTENIFGYLLFIIRNYVRAMPTLLFLLSVVLILGQRRYRGGVSLLWSIVIVSLGITPAYLLEMRWNPTWMRYLNMFLCLYAVFVTAAVLPVLYDLLTGKRLLTAFACGAGIFHLAEVMGSMPAFTYFAPCWYGVTAAGVPAQEREMDVYWGEHRESLGLLVWDYCDKNGLGDEPITIYYGYIRGDWLTRPAHITEAPKDWNESYDTCSVTDHDFYAFDTQAVQRGMVKDGWPVDVEPVITVTYRGHVTARIYQGSQLRDYFGK